MESALIAPLPLTTHTFLFSDIEGSTRLWEAFPEPMRLALREHDARLREAFAKYRGEVFKTIGDAFCVAFSQATDAVAAALTAQRSIADIHVAGEQSLRVRMAVHTGLAEQREGDYFGPALNRTARQLGVAYGGQVLVSQATQILVRTVLPPEASLRALGEHRLKDLEQPEPLYQLCHPELPAVFPALRSLTTIPNNLPIQLTAFLGREAALVQVKTLLERHRLVTLTGSGGVGKTRLALQSTAEILENLPDGAFFLDLTVLSDPALIPQLLVTTLGLTERPGQPPVETLIEHLRPRTLLLLWDNVEHLLDHCAALITQLLQSCPQLRLLTTSREPLGIPGEKVWRVPSFDLAEALRFFLDRVALHHNDFRATPEAEASIARICQRLDGIPLALELAAARVRTLSPQQIEARLEDVFRLLTGTNKRSLPRQQTLRALIDWSYDLLNDQEKRLLRRLSLFVGGWTLEAAEAVCQDEALAGDDIFDLLTALIEKSLVGVEEGPEYRYRLLEVLRQYSHECMQQEDGPEQRKALQEAHCLWYSELTEKTEAVLNGSEQAYWIHRLEKEHDNLRQAQESGGKAALRITAALVGFWKLRGYLSEGYQRLQRALTNPEQTEADPLLRARLLAGAALLAAQLGKYEEASRLQQECLTLALSQGDKTQAARAMIQLGLLAVSQGNLDQADRYYDDGVALFREINELRGVAWALNIQGILARQRGELELARQRYQESLRLQRQFGKPENIAACLNNLGLLALDQGDFNEARALYGEALQISQGLGNRRSMAAALHNLGMTARRERQLADAKTFLTEALTLVREIGDPQVTVLTLLELGYVTHDEGQDSQAHSLLGECSVLIRQLGLKPQASELLELWASIHHAQGSRQRASQLLEAAETLRRELGQARSPWAQRNFERLGRELEGEPQRAAPGWEILLREEETRALQHP